MCGITGIIKIDGNAIASGARQSVQEMLNRMTWRGPDGEGIWQEGPVCFGHRRLSIIDIAGGAQPMHYANGLTIVFNGEIYNFKHIRSLLREKGFSFTNESDTQVILAAYAAWDISCLEMLEGMFAFALWDENRHRLFCARDHFGKKPFYYTIQNGYFAFSSDLGSLTSLKTVEHLPRFNFTVSKSAFLRYLAYEYVPVPQTIYNEVHVLEPAHCLLLEKGRLKLNTYWELPFPEKNLPAPEVEVRDELYRLMLQSVRMRMISDVPLGVFLSGGIDSTIVTGLMASLSEKPVQAFSIGFKEASYDESKYAAIAARAFGAEWHERLLSAEDCAEELPKLARKVDVPMADASSAPTWLLSGLARENVTVALGGDGADEFWAGYEHYIGYKVALVYNRLPETIQNCIEGLTGFLPQSSGYINPRQAVRTFLAGAKAPDWLRVQSMLTALMPEKIREIVSLQWIGKEGLNILKPEILFASTAKNFLHWQDKSVSPLERAFYVYIRQFMLDDILVKVDRCSMLHSLEVRAPFLDKNTCEFVARLPVSAKLNGFKRKYLLKKTFSKLLPSAILNRNKRGFQIPVAEWLRTKLKPLLMDFLSKEYLAKQGIFNPAPIGEMMNAHFCRKKDYRKQLWTLLVLQLWLDANKPDFK